MTIDITPYRINHYSQSGEDGVIQKLFEILHIDSGLLIEFGAWDGINLSNTYYHYQRNKNFNVLLIETQKERYDQCVINFLERAIIINKEVQFYGLNCLNRILADHKVKNIELLSIDVDGLDLELFLSLDKNKYRPKIIIIEFGKWNDRAQLDYLSLCFNQYGYNLVCVTGNFIFVRSDLGITSDLNIHELLEASGCVDYDRMHNLINEEEYNQLCYQIYHPKEYPDIFAKRAKPQLINYE